MPPMRLVNIAGSALALILLSPILVLLAVLVTKIGKWYEDLLHYCLS